MVSYDISSLFTNTHVHQTTNILTEIIFQPQDMFHEFNKKLFTYFRKITASDVLFSSYKTLYVQIKGLGMGIPFTPTPANIFLCYIKELMFGRCPDDINYAFVL